MPGWWAQDGRRVSTLDLVGKGKFSLVTGIAGQAWVDAAKELDLPFLQNGGHRPAGLRRTSYCSWHAVREIEEAGALLVRPDGVVAWRQHGWRGRRRAGQARARAGPGLAAGPDVAGVGGGVMERAFLGMSHTPLMGLNPVAPAVEQRAAGRHRQAREQVLAFAPELVVLVAPDHYNGFFNELMPPFCIGTQARSVGDYLSPAGTAQRGCRRGARAGHAIDG